MKNKNGNEVNGESVKAECAGDDSDEGNKFQRVNSVKVEKVSRGENVKIERSSKYLTLKSERAVKSESSFTDVQSENVTVLKTESTTSKSVKIEKKPKDEKSPNVVSAAPPKLSALVYCKDSVRDKVRELLAEALCKVSGEVDDDLRDTVNACDPYRVAVQVETAMFEKWGKSSGAQKLKYRSIMFNIKDPNSPDFRRKVLIGQYPPRSIVELSPEEMASAERQKENKKIKEKALFNSELGGPPKASTDKFKCGRCGKNQTTYYQMQTRSADEPMTTYVTCIVCDNRWKFC
ncbi:hypothetical protein K7X08_035583 [Anisodus acutangulus]|uniref:Transcription elongation factor n=1 Tax=Anisodus acutangulus TaxID=402998 RepID=A0A9Q1R411_9SOLA|nr:hypothetical protein K7X08_035583 [Anisodus acutangulus]